MKVMNCPAKKKTLDSSGCEGLGCGSGLVTRKPQLARNVAEVSMS
jgi:hypothetical protein